MAWSYWRGSHYLEWLLDRQDVMIHRANDLKVLGSEEEYQKVMIFFADVIQMFGRNVEVRQQVIATATVYFKRFYSRNSLKSIDPWLMAPSCLFLASKVEEFGVLSQKSLLTACRSTVHNHYSAYFPEGFGYPYRAQDVLECEFILLEAMDCSLIVFHPYRPVLQFCEELRPQLHELAELLLERAWWVVNDSFRSDVCLHYPPFIIALGCLQTAFILLANNTELLTRVSGSNSVSSSSNKHAYFSHQQPTLSVNPLTVANRWFSELNIDMEKVLEVTRQLFNLYDLWRRFDEPSEMPTILLKKFPRPVVQPPPPHTCPSFAGAVNATQNASAGCGSGGGGTNQSSASMSVSGVGGQGHHVQFVSSSNGSATGAAAGSCNTLQDQQQQHSRNVVPSSGSQPMRMQQQGGMAHMQMR